jgi:FtsP/CotA-like multicopper oxidase with cupredoxin domain
MKKIKDVAWLIFAVAMIGYFISLVAKRFLTDHIAEKNIRYTKAIIINHKNYDVNNRVTSDFSYSYSFTVDGKTYDGNSHDETLKIGDTVEIEYDKNHPSLNKPLHPKE